MEESINTPFELHELEAAIRHSKKNSSPGNDYLTYEMLKKPSKTLSTSSSQILQQYMATRNHSKCMEGISSHSNPKP